VTRRCRGFRSSHPAARERGHHGRARHCHPTAWSHIQMPACHRDGWPGHGQAWRWPGFFGLGPRGITFLPMQNYVLVQWVDWPAKWTDAFGSEWRRLCWGSMFRRFSSLRSKSAVVAAHHWHYQCITLRRCICQYWCWPHSIYRQWAAAGACPYRTMWREVWRQCLLPAPACA
jgi:hypothetical protein